MTTANSALGTVESDLVWVKAHLVTVIVAFVLLGGTAVGSVYGVESLLAKRDLATEQRYNTLLSGEVANTKAAQATLATTLSSFNDTLHQMQTANAALAQSIVNRNIQTQKQVKIDATLDSQQTAQRLSSQTSAQAGQVTANGSDITVDLPIARSIVADLDGLAGTQQNLVATQKELDNTNQMYTASQQVVAAQKKTLDAVITENAGQVKACAAQVTALKAQNRKSKMKWFGAGFITGFITGIFAGHAAGI